ncbi:MAG: hypothetical protein J6V44_03630 [Methanobrevibacter sp.]|nr:hypothetical protein [Methanobrevibacter sp.]
MADEFDKFHKELRKMIQSETRVAYPIIGVVVNVSPTREYCDVETDDGVISNIPAHGMPVVGDSAIIHFINGNYEQPVVDCARRLPTPESEIMDMYQSQCFNFHNNGDFSFQKEGYEGDFTLWDGINDDVTGNDTCCKLEEGQHISFTVDLSECKKDVFKFQAMYRGISYLVIKVEDVDTGETIKNLPVNIGEEFAVWGSKYGRYNWVYNKEAYLLEDHEKVKFTITNMDDEEHERIINGVRTKVKEPMLIDAILVYEENSDTGYYYSPNDMTTFVKS